MFNLFINSLFTSKSLLIPMNNNIKIYQSNFNKIFCYILYSNMGNNLNIHQSFFKNILNSIIYQESLNNLILNDVITPNYTTKVSCCNFLLCKNRAINVDNSQISIILSNNFFLNCSKNDNGGVMLLNCYNFFQEKNFYTKCSSYGKSCVCIYSIQKNSTISNLITFLECPNIYYSSAIQDHISLVLNGIQISKNINCSKSFSNGVAGIYHHSSNYSEMKFIQSDQNQCSNTLGYGNLKSEFFFSFINLINNSLIGTEPGLIRAYFSFPQNLTNFYVYKINGFYLKSIGDSKISFINCIFNENNINEINIINQINCIYVNYSYTQYLINSFKFDCIHISFFKIKKLNSKKIISLFILKMMVIS